MEKIDETGNTVKIDPDTELVRVDGIIVFRRVDKCGKIYIRFMDRDRMRSRCRGTPFVEIPLEVLTRVLK